MIQYTIFEVHWIVKSIGFSYLRGPIHGFIIIQGSAIKVQYIE